MQIEKLNSPNDRAIYLDGDESNNQDGNVITELTFHGMVSFVDYEQLVLGMDAMCARNSRLETELVKAKKKIAELENNSR
jgi:hypothetical protein